MGGEKSKSGNGKRQNKESVSYDVNDQEEESTTYDVNKKNITEQNTNEQDSNEQDTIVKENVTVQEPSSDAADTPNDCDIKALADKVVNINILRFELDRLQLDFKARAYFENDIRPLIDTLYTLSYASMNYSTTAKNYAGINFGHSSKIKDALDLSEEANVISEDLIEVLRCKVHNMLKFSRYDCK